jgi:GNAT superfamily N-acetyltransferase
MPNDYVVKVGWGDEWDKKTLLNAVIRNHHGIEYIDYNNQSASWEAIIKYAKKQGYDGVFMYDESIDKLIQHQISQIVFNPTQIKLADGSNTTFDGSNPDIRYADGGMTYQQYRDSQFDEQVDRHLPSGYLGEFEIKLNTKSNYPILYLEKDGYEYRLKNKNDSAIGVFHLNKQVGYADNKAIHVAPMYQKKGIGLNLVSILKERNPNHRFGSMTPEGFNLMGKYYDEKIKTNPDIGFAKGGKINIDDYMLVTYHEKVGNWAISKNEIYLWLYDDMDAGNKLQSGEFDYVLFPPRPPIQMAFKKNYVPPLLQVWTKKYQNRHKGSDKLMAIIRAWYDETNHKLYILMMTTRKDLRKRGIISSMIKELRKKFNIEQEDVIFDDPTEEGKAVMESKKFDKGGKTETYRPYSNLDISRVKKGVVQLNSVHPKRITKIDDLPI